MVPSCSASAARTWAWSDAGAVPSLHATAASPMRAAASVSSMVCRMSERLLSKFGTSTRTPRDRDAHQRVLLRPTSKRADDPWESPARARRQALLAARQVQLDVPTTQRARRRVVVRKVEREHVVASGLAVVHHVHLIFEPVLAIHLCGTFDVPGRRVHHCVGGYAGALHLRPVGTVIDVGQ